MVQQHVSMVMSQPTGPRVPSSVSEAHSLQKILGGKIGTENSNCLWLPAVETNDSSAHGGHVPQMKSVGKLPSSAAPKRSELFQF